ncbi:unnamed protein product [Didymodactylos carnosus]|uniref:Uncharacterized protein n=1 Tax=Didymodactylos carnosus TaxID=1234261 RepID=A0A8S2EP04_9BILA|nr:unnamed protein product [Didymodactylos carnosus]CAF4023926.1 unnamed protein product [Didymodactylos carnosus]
MSSDESTCRNPLEQNSTDDCMNTKKADITVDGKFTSSSRASNEKKNVPYGQTVIGNMNIKTSPTTENNIIGSQSIVFPASICPKAAEYIAQGYQELPLRKRDDHLLFARPYDEVSMDTTTTTTKPESVTGGNRGTVCP